MKHKKKEISKKHWEGWYLNRWQSHTQEGWAVEMEGNIIPQTFAVTKVEAMNIVLERLDFLPYAFEDFHKSTEYRVVKVRVVKIEDQEYGMI